MAATADYQTLRKRFAKPLAEEGVPPEQVVEELARGVEGGLLGTAGGRFFGWVIGGSVPAALAADLMTSGWEQNAALYACSPAAAVVEEVAGGWLKEILGLPAGASFALVTGCQMAHVTCLAAARHCRAGETRMGCGAKGAGRRAGNSDLFKRPAPRHVRTGLRLWAWEVRT